MKLETRARVLVVDDEAVNRRVACGLCEAFGCDVAGADSAAQAVAFCAEHLYDLVLMDIRMPGVDGFQATRLIRALPGAHGRAPSSRSRPTRRRVTHEPWSAGIDTVVEKPILAPVLFEALRRTLDARSRVAASQAV